MCFDEVLQVSKINILVKKPFLGLFCLHSTSSRSVSLQSWAVYGMGDETKSEQQIDDLLKMLAIDVSPLLMSKRIRLLIKGR